MKTPVTQKRINDPVIVIIEGDQEKPQCWIN